VALSIAGAGTVLISLIIAARDDHHPRTIWAVAAVPGVAVFALVWFQPDLELLLPIALAFGLADSAAGIPLAATIAEAMPDDIRGRAYAANESIYDVGSVVGSLGFAWLGEASRLGVVASMTLAAASGAVLGGVVLAGGGLAAIAAFERRRLEAIGATGWSPAAS
jgi:predicted MFS family arabinose efflux permease